MQIVIEIHDIPTNDHERWVLAHGTPLPKHHGRLIDADVVVDGFEDNYELCIAVNDTPTIIPARKRVKRNDKRRSDTYR